MKSWNDVGRSAHFLMNILKLVSRSDQYATREVVFLSCNITPINRLLTGNRCLGHKTDPRANLSRSGVGQVRYLRPEMGEPTPRSGPYSPDTGLVAEQQTQSDVQHGALRTRVGCPA